MYSFDVETPVEKAGSFRKSLWDEVRRFCDEGPTEAEIERAKVAIESERVYGSQSMDGLSNRLGFLKTTLGNTRFDLEYMVQARELTTEDVRDASRQFLNLESIREFALLPKSFEQKTFWDSATAPAPQSKKRVTRTVVDREQVSLPNGIELVLYPRQDVPVVSMQACAFGGLRIEDHDSAGIGNLLADTWEKGPSGWTASKFSEYLDARGARIDAFSGRNSLGLGCTSLTRYLDDIAPLYAETLCNPALHSEEFRRAQTVALEDIRTLEDDLGRLVGRLFCENLFEGHPYSQAIIGSKDSVEKLTAAKLGTHYDSLVRGAPLVIAVSGKFNPARIISLFEKIKRPTSLRATLAELPASPPKAPRIVEVKKNREQSHIIVGFQGTRVTDRERYDLKMLLTVLGGQSGRLFTELRDKQGLCYTVAPISFEGIEPGYVGVYMGCDPGKRTQALVGIQKELERIASKPVSATELKRAKEFILGRHHMDMQLNSAIANSSAFSTLYGLGFDEHLKLGENLRRVSPLTLQKLASKIFHTSSVTALVI
ncbi:MAG: insulinase family protein [Deltaproteobacteria bacterium]|nr:insulinase family protein [Deltaproteobacteria bacterium]